jgi:multicomponent Na+:H+ antiporter subunit A
MAAAVFLPLLATPIIPLLGRAWGKRVGWFALIFPITSLLAVLGLVAGTEPGARTVVSWAWIPSLGVNLSFLVDGLSLMFGLIVSGMGVLIFFYANFYLNGHYRHHGRFYCYLTLFMAAMLGTVFSDHLVLLFVFWELTGLASFLLIGFLHEEKDARVGARQSLLVTTLTGLVMLVGIILLGQVSGEYSLSALLSGRMPSVESSPLVGWAMALILIGAFGKSAQVPFHFWLPNAMAAPTPVSAYLHSATMVKLGVFLAARIFPLFVAQAGWAPLLVLVGFTTMVLGAVFALASHDLKAILAYSTVSALGSFLGYYGLGAVAGVHHDYLHILNHVFYKGCLFMVAGVVTHATGIRDIRELGGLFHRLPLLGFTALVACASMAGLPGTMGFLSKEAMLGTVFSGPSVHGWIGVYALASVVVASTAKVAFAVRLFLNVFGGKEPRDLEKRFHAPGWGMQLPAVLLAFALLGIGWVPGLLEPALHRLGTPGLNASPAPLALWHGLTGELLASASIALAGFGLYGVGQKTAWRWATIPGWLRVDRWFEAGLDGLDRFCLRATAWLKFDQPMAYLPIFVAFSIAVAGGFLWIHFSPLNDRTGFWRSVSTFNTVYALRVFVALLMALAVLGVVVLKRWTTQLIFLSVSGFLVTFYYVLYQAPDLALTQILVDTVTLILILILLGRFHRGGRAGEVTAEHSRPRQVFNALLAVGVGLVVTAIVLIMTAQPHPDRIGRRFLETTVGLARGSNAVNTILVDYRGFDTLFEITVLFIAMLGCLGLVTRHKRTEKEFKEGPLAPPGLGWTEEDK